jgi:hypothetical protein
VGEIKWMKGVIDGYREWKRKRKRKRKVNGNREDVG